MANIRDVTFPLAPLPEQERIVARLEELLSDLEAGAAALERVRAGVKRYKATVLNAAVTGNLVERIDAEGDANELLKEILKFRGGKPIKRQVPLDANFDDILNVPDLPNHWTWATLDQLTWSVRDGMHFSPKYVSEGIPFITGGNVRPTGIDFANARRISPELHEKLLRFRPDKGDILYTKGGTTGIARVQYL